MLSVPFDTPHFVSSSCHVMYVSGIRHQMTNLIVTETNFHSLVKNTYFVITLT